MTRGQVTTFYSYKGGAGRTFLLANVGWLLARWGRKVLCLDWDLEAPGLYRYLAPDAPLRDGVLDIILSLRAEADLPAWRDLRHEVGGPWVGDGALHLIGAGRGDDRFVSRVQGLRWDDLSALGLETALERVRAEWVEEYDHVLIDSRTGITDVGGICAAQLPDLLVVAFTAAHQSLDGAVDVARRAQSARANMPLDRGGFPVLPVPCRIHTGEEELLEKEWSHRFETRLEPLFAPWKDLKVRTHEYISHLRVCERARWSFGEQVPVRTEALDDPNRISYAFANIAALVDRRLEDSGAIVRRRHEYVSRVAGESGLAAVEGAGEADFDVFISHPRAHKDAARELAAALRSSGVRVFLDHDVPLGANWSEALYKARERSRMFLVLIPEQDLGPGQTEELAHIYRRMSERGVSVVPVFLTTGAVSRAPPQLADLYGVILPEEGSWDAIATRVVRRLRARDAKIDNLTEIVHLTRRYKADERKPIAPAVARMAPTKAPTIGAATRGMQQVAFFGVIDGDHATARDRVDSLIRMADPRIAGEFRAKVARARAAGATDFEILKTFRDA
jgi:hypothetical protein